MATGVADGEQRSCSGDGAAAEFYGSVALASGGRKEKGAGDRGREWPGSPSRRPDQGGWRPAAARPTPAYGRHVAGAGWSEARPRAWERRERGAGRAARWAEREAGLAQQRLPLLFFF